MDTQKNFLIKLMGKKILTILRSIFFFCLTKPMGHRIQNFIVSMKMEDSI